MYYEIPKSRQDWVVEKSIIFRLFKIP